MIFAKKGQADGPRHLMARCSLAALVIGAALIALPLGVAAHDESPKSTALFSGSDFKDSATFSHYGIVHALNGNLNKDGFLLRAALGYGQYQYQTVAVPKWHVHTDLYQGDVGAGYQMFFGGLRGSVYLSANYVNHDQDTRDVRNPTRGEEWGFKVQGEVETTGGSPLYGSLIGSYSTAFNSYWTRARGGLEIGHGIAIGPEFIALGNEGYDQVRYGAFIKGLPVPIIGSRLSLSVGWADNLGDRGIRNGVGNGRRDDNDSLYVTVGSSLRF